jgi:hypothetical protein
MGTHNRSRKIQIMCLSTLLLILFNNLYSQTKNGIGYTPFGPVSQSNIHYINNKQNIEIKNEWVQIKNSKSSNIVSTVDKKIQKKGNEISSQIRYTNGWNTYAYSPKRPRFFSTKWIVPPPPKENRGQLLYIFNALFGREFLSDGSFSDHIIQPVLQWGRSPAGGGDYWAICNWYVAGENYYYDSLIKVNQNTILEGIIERSYYSDTSFSYKSSFSGYTTSLHANNLPLLEIAYEALESYGADNHADYPENEKIRMFDIHIDSDIKDQEVLWQSFNLGNPSNELGQFTKIINQTTNGGEIDIFFHSPYSENNFDEIHIYPNPVNDYLHISPNTIKEKLSMFPDRPISNCTISIYDMLGTLIQTNHYEILTSEFDLNLSYLTTGVYFMKFSYDKRSHIFKFIKK